MTPDEQAAIDKIEAERRQREKLLLLAMLLLASTSRTHAIAAIRLGHSPLDAIRGVWLGNEALDLPGIVPALQEALIDAHAAGYQRASKLIGEEPPVEPPDVLEDVYQPQAQQAAQQMTDTLVKRVGAGFDLSGSIAKQIRGVGIAFEQSGYNAANPSSLVTASTLNILNGYGNGMFEGYRVAKGDIFLRHYSILDEATTDICRQRNGLTLKKNNAYWRNGGWPPLHARCRSIVLVAKDAIRESSWLPTIPPAPGFGFAGPLVSLLA